MINKKSDILTVELKKKIDGLIDAKKYKDALTMVNDILHRDPNNPDGLSMKASILGLGGQYESALEVVNLALKDRPDDYTLWHRKGISLYYLGKYPEALDAFEQCLKIRPSFVRALSKKISSLTLMGKYQLAVELFEESDLTEDTYNDQLNNIGYACLELGDYEKAEKYLNEAKLKQPHVVVFFNIAELYRRKKKYTKFIIALLRAKFKKFCNKHFHRADIRRKKFGSDLFIGPGKLFTTNSQIREIKAILKLFGETPHWAALCNDTFKWFAINIPYNLLGNNNFKGDIDIIVSMPKGWPPKEDGPSWYRSFEVKSILVEKTGKARSLGQGRRKKIKISKQLKKLKNFGCEQIILLEIYGLERGFSDKFDFPTQEIIDEINDKVNLIKNDGFGYLIIANEPSATHQDGFGGKFFFPNNILVGQLNTVSSPFNELVDYIDKFSQSEIKQRNVRGLPLICYCRKCKKLILVDASDKNLICYHCNQSILKYL